MFEAMFNALNAWEVGILEWIQEFLRTPFGDWFMPAVTVLGNKGLFSIALGLGLLIPRRTRKMGATVLIALLLGLLVGNLCLKPLVGRIRPYDFRDIVPPFITESSKSFPSGHSLAAFETAVAILLYNRKRSLPAVTVSTVAMALAATVAFSRLYLFVHYPTDVIAGSLLGACFAVVAYLFVNKLLFAKVPQLGAWSFKKWGLIRDGEQ